MFDTLPDYAIRSWAGHGLVDYQQVAPPSSGDGCPNDAAALPLVDRLLALLDSEATVVTGRHIATADELAAASVGQPGHAVASTSLPSRAGIGSVSHSISAVLVVTDASSTATANHADTTGGSHARIRVDQHRVDRSHCHFPS